MIVDTSALIAILRAEPEASAYARAIEAAGVCRLSVASYVEVGAVIDRAGDAIASRRVDELLAVTPVEIEAMTPSQARLAREAYRDFGRGSGHAAGLNFGDCFSYALARDKGEPLLFKGEDFRHTDITPAVAE
ncbi:MAG TPA: type II toxin-antitoxin system VapC family toxin [Solirubrobacteraceae bacterium]